MDTATISKYVYTVNPIGQRISLAQTGTAFATAKSVEWGYDPLGQVTTADHSENTQDRAYLYDAIGNRQRAATSTLDASDPTATVYASNTLNQYTTIQENSANNPVNPVNTVPTYDQDGNTLTEGNKTHTWDAENRLIKVQIGETEVNDQYDSQSRRITRAEGLDKTVQLYDAWNNIAEYKFHNSTFILHNSYAWGIDLSGSEQRAGGVGGLLSVIKFPLPLGEGQGEGATYYVAYDGNGNISEYLDEEGVTAAHFEYDPFGNTTVNTDTDNNFPYRFSTKPLDPTTDLYYFGFRDYNSVTGRWETRDPIEESGGANLYGFVGNDGVQGIDLLGLENVVVEAQVQVTNKNQEVSYSVSAWRKVPDQLHEVTVVTGFHNVYKGTVKTWKNEWKMITETEKINLSLIANVPLKFDPDIMSKPIINGDVTRNGETQILGGGTLGPLKVTHEQVATQTATTGDIVDYTWDVSVANTRTLIVKLYVRIPVDIKSTWNVFGSHVIAGWNTPIGTDVRRAKQGASCQVKDLMFQNLASRNYRVLQLC